MKIFLKTMTLQNFRKVRSKTINFGQKVIISGGNETGKSTIYDAYLWCLFGVTSRPDTTVQTLDMNNNVIHKLETSVSIIINYNDERDIKIERRLAERYKAENTVNEKLMGTMQTRLIDDVPFSVTAFKEKLNSLCNYEDWFLLSNINLFWGYKIDQRRRILMSLAGDINEEEIMQNFPAVYKGVVVEKKEISDILSQQKITRKKANDELLTIPAKVQAQDALRTDDDFDDIESEKDNVEKQLLVIDNAMQGVVGNVSEQEEYNIKLTEATETYNKTRQLWQEKHFEAIDASYKKETAASEQLSKAQLQQKEHLEENVRNKIKLEKLKEEFNVLMQQWKDVNEKEFNFAKTDVCPVCGRPYTDEMQEQEYQNAVNEFNTNKSHKLTEIQDKAKEKNSQITALKGTINVYEQVTSEEEKKNIAELSKTHDSFSKRCLEIRALTWENSAEKVTADNTFNAVKLAKPEIIVDKTLEENRLKKAELTKKRDELIKRLSKRDTNERIKEEKEKLDYRSRELSQIIVNCNQIIQQVKDYKKAKITIIEDKVNAFFSLIRWKFYEQNITNNEEKEICTAIDRHGVDYNNTNDGTVINMGIDIINGISKAKDIFVPLFVDRKESIEKALPSKQQTIYLQCIYDKPFEITSI